jgi:hypothetical protein
MANASSVFALLAQKAVDSLNEQTFAPAAEAQRGWRIFLRVTDTDQPVITVIPTAKTVTNAARRCKQNVVSLTVIIQRQHGGASGEEDPIAREDEVASLAQQVEDYLSSPANAMVVFDGEGDDIESFSAEPTGTVSAEVIQEWLAENVFAVMFTVEYTLFRNLR